jgi:predicted RNA binding protein YcfA (HicA-like mRNA interferase family)
VSGPTPVLAFCDVDRALGRLGFVAVWQKGSHAFDRHPDGRTTTVPSHKRRDIAVPLLRKFLDEVRRQPDAFLRARAPEGGAHQPIDEADSARHVGATCPPHRKETPRRGPQPRRTPGDIGPSPRGHAANGSSGAWHIGGRRRPAHPTR